MELYYYWKNKLIELEYRLSPIYYLSQSKNDNPEQRIINIKWGFEVKGKNNSRIGQKDSHAKGCK